MTVADEIQQELDRTPPSPRSNALKRWLVEATFEALVCVGADGGDLDALHARAVESARRYGTSEDRLRVEVERARAEMTRLRFDEARATLEKALATIQDAPINRPDGLLALADAETRLCRPDRALRHLDSARQELLQIERQLAAEKEQPEREAILGFTRWTSFNVESAVRANALELGLPDEAARAFERERRALADLKTLQAAGINEEILLACDGCALGQALLDFDAARACLDALPADLEPTLRANVEMRRAMLSCNAAGASGATGGDTRLQLETLFGSSDLSAEIRIAPGLALAESACNERRVDDARRVLDAVQALIVELPPAACTTRRTVAMTAALRARIALSSGAPRTEIERFARELDTAFESVLDGWRGMEVRAHGVGLLFWLPARMTLNSLIEVELALDPTASGREKALRHVLRAQAVGSLSRLLAAEIPTLAEIRRELLGPAQGLVIFVPGDERSRVFVIDAQRIECLALDPWSSIVPSVRAFDLELSVPPANERSAELATAARELARVLLPQSLRELGAHWTGVYFVGSELFGCVDLEAVPWGDGSLGLELDCAHLPSVPAALVLAARARATRADSELDLVSCAAPLVAPSIAREFQSAARPIPCDDARERSFDEWAAPGRARTLCRGRMTWSGLSAALEARPSVLAVLTHGVTVPSLEAPAALAFSAEPSRPRGLVGADDILSGPRFPRTTLLFACGAGRSTLRFGDDAGASFSSALLARGACSVVLSRGDVDHGAATRALETMVPLLLRDRASAASALRRARREIADDSRTADPFFWGRLQAHGVALLPCEPAGASSRAPASPSSSSSSLRWIAIAAALGLLALAWVGIGNARRRARARTSGAD